MKIESTMDHPNEENSDLVRNSVLYKEFLAEREQILCHKWLESEKAGYDIGFERALLDWIVRYRSEWREKRLQQGRSGPSGTVAPAAAPVSFTPHPVAAGKSS